MRKLLLQHWAGAAPEVVTRSTVNISAYAERCGADYQLVEGYPWDDRLTAPCQKLYMLSPVFDDYDVVVMLDADMFAVTGCEESIFDAEPAGAVGWYHDGSHPRVVKRLPELTSRKAPFWGGAVYRLTRDLRVRLRAEYAFDEAVHFNSRDCGEDEGIMHRLAMRAGLVSSPELYLSKRWCWGSHEPVPERAAIVHVRSGRMRVPNGTKLDNYRELRERGVIV